MKKIFIVLVTIFLAFGFSGSIEARDSSEKRMVARVDKVQDKTVEEIDMRVEGMKKLIDKLNGMKKITSDQKAKLVAQVQTEIDSLLAIKASLTTETDLEKLKNLRKSVVTSYRIFAIFIPRTNLLAYGDSLINIADKMLSLENISEEAKTLINQSKEKTLGAMNLALTIVPSGYPENKTVLQDVKRELLEARKLLNEARKLLKKEV